MKVAKPKPKRPAVEQKKTEKVKVEFKKRIPQEFQDFAESKIHSFSDCNVCVCQKYNFFCFVLVYLIKQDGAYS